jgi:hypothetical protein
MIARRDEAADVFKQEGLGLQFVHEPDELLKKEAPLVGDALHLASTAERLAGRASED